jgi:hypothetical protein
MESKTEVILHMLKSRHYIVSTLNPEGIKTFIVEPGVALLQNQHIRICRVAEVRIRPLNIPPPKDVIDDPRAKMLIEKVGKLPAVKLFQYTFIPVGVRLIQRLDTGAEFYSIGEPIGNPITAHIAHVYYVIYQSRSGKIYDEEVEGGVKAYTLFKRGELTWPQIYLHKRDGHRTEIGVRIPIDYEQIAPVISYLYSCQQLIET